MAPALEENLEAEHHVVDMHGAGQVQEFGLQLFEDMEDEELIEMIMESGFVVPEDSACRAEIIARLRQMDVQ